MIRLGPGAEFDLIRGLVGERVDIAGVEVGPGDDCAVLDGGVVLTCDLTVEDVHFRRAWLSPRETGYRAATASLSDLAAMAATPVAVLVSYALPTPPPDDGEAEGAVSLASEVHAGVQEACRRVGAGVAGGDVTASPGPLVVDVMAVGRTAAPVLRSGARPGDELWVTGRLGAAAAAVALLLDGRDPPAALRDRFARPTARTAEALWLAGRAPLHALIDLSDGLAGDAAHVAAASDATLVIEAAAVPVAPAAIDDLGEEEALSLALSGGEDYELLMAVRPGSLEGLAESFLDTFGTPLTRIGRVEARGGAPVLLEGSDGTTRPLDGGGFDHFAPAGGG